MCLFGSVSFRFMPGPPRVSKAAMQTAQDKADSAELKQGIVQRGIGRLAAKQARPENVF